MLSCEAQTIPKLELPVRLGISRINVPIHGRGTPRPSVSAILRHIDAMAVIQLSSYDGHLVYEPHLLGSVEF